MLIHQDGRAMDKESLQLACDLSHTKVEPDQSHASVQPQIIEAETVHPETVIPIHREIMDKLQRERNLNSKRSSEGLSSRLIPDGRYPMDNHPMLADPAAFHAAMKFHLQAGSIPPTELMQRDMLLAMHTNRAQMDYLHHLASAQEHQSSFQLSKPSKGNNSPLDPDSDEEDELQVETISPPQGSGQWTYEEQFKQLYEMGNEPDRKQFLDDLFAYMQKRGSPVNRIPIMAKQTLDIYMLFKLVVAKGGLVEIINKKLWREITKGLNLPSSITSAAFTLRTQYMKYLYPYECEKFSFSSLSELQTAIDGNKREGRTPTYGFNAPPAAIPHPFFGSPMLGNHALFNQAMFGNSMANMMSSQLGSPFLANNGHHTPRPTITNSRISSESECDDNIPSPAARQPLSPRVTSSAFTSVRSLQDNDSLNREVKRFRGIESPVIANGHSSSNGVRTNETKELLDSQRKFAGQQEKRMNETHIKISNSQDGNGSEIIVSMEINGTTYTGVLYAQKSH